MADNFWTEEHVEQLKDYWTEGLSCSQISRAFGHIVSRNSVIGKVSRLGLSSRSTTMRMTRTRRVEAPPRPKVEIVTVAAPVAEEDPVVLEDGSHVTIMTVTDRMCRWPIGDPAAYDFHFCGRSPKSGSPYCEAHARKAYQPQMTAASRKKAEAVDIRVKDRAARMGL